jgi:hypothetical protein
VRTLYPRNRRRSTGRFFEGIGNADKYVIGTHYNDVKVQDIILLAMIKRIVEPDSRSSIMNVLLGCVFVIRAVSRYGWY